MSNILERVWDSYLHALARIPQPIVGAAVAGVGILVTSGVTIAAGWYNSYRVGERQIVAFHQVALLHDEEIRAYAELGSLVERFNAEFSGNYEAISIQSDLDQMELRLASIRRSRPVDLGVKEIMEDFGNRVQAIRQLQAQMRRLSGQINEPWVVKSGDAHSEIAWSFLRDEIGVSDAEARRIIERTGLIWDLEPGNYIYNVYVNGIYLTTVTQGEAQISPQQAAARTRLSLNQRIKKLQQRLVDFEAEVAQLPSGESVSQE